MNRLIGTRIGGLTQGSEQVQTRFAQRLLVIAVGLSEGEISVFQRKTGFQGQSILENGVADENLATKDLCRNGIFRPTHHTRHDQTIALGRTDRTATGSQIDADLDRCSTAIQVRRLNITVRLGVSVEIHIHDCLPSPSNCCPPISPEEISLKATLAWNNWSRSSSFL